MKKVITIVLSVLTFVSCTKKSSSTGSSGTGGGSSVTLNATETSLLGTWFMKKYEMRYYSPSVYNRDTTITNWEKNNYLEFKKEPFVGTSTSTNAGTHKQCNDSRIGAVVPQYWYYDPVIGVLIIGGFQFEIISQAGILLTIKTKTTGVREETYYLSK